jgi:hypothetical protein
MGVKITCHFDLEKARAAHLAEAATDKRQIDAQGSDAAIKV